MKECFFGHQELPSDSTFCINCGKEINQDLLLKINVSPSINNWGKLGIILLIFALIIIDFIIATIAVACNFNVKIIFMISLFVYLGAIGCGVKSLYQDYRDKQLGHKMTGSSGIALVAIFVSFYILLVNLINVILK